MSTHPHPHPHPPSPGGLHPHHGPMNHHPQVNGHIPVGSQAANTSASAQRVTQLNEEIWLQIGGLTEVMGDLDGAMQAYEQALRHNQWSIRAMNGISAILRTREMFPKAVEYLLSISKLDPTNGETWGSLGHCYLMMDDLQQAYSSYQQALYHLPDPKEPKLWYGIGILYDRYGSLEHAEEAFSQVMHMAPDFEKANEIYFRLGIIYKQQQKFSESLECFKYIVNDPPRPLTEEDIWFQIGHVHEQQKDYDAAKAAYRRVLEREPNHAKVLQQLGWLHHQQSSSYNSQEQAIEYLEKSVSADNSDAQSWYLLGRCYMSQAKYPKAYEAYQQAVYRDGRNPTFWCSIGVLYYQINQYRDALDAYSRAIRLNPYISEVWYDLGTLYESCNNQTSDALDAYSRAAELDPSNVHIKARLQLLRNGQATGINQANAPVPQDVHPQAYQAAGVGAPPGPPGPQWGAPAPAPAPPVPGPPPSGRIGDWARGISDIQTPQTQPHPPNPYDQRDGLRGPPPPPPRQPSPRQDPMRPFAEPHRHTPVRKGLSPSPKINQVAPTPYSGPQTLPQLGPHAQQPPPPPPQQPQQPQRGLMVNPNFSSVAPAGASSASTNPPSTGPLPSFSSRPFSPGPGPEIRPIIDDRTSSPGSSYQHQQYQHHANTSVPAGIASGAPPPAAAMAAAEAAARERDDRPASAAPGPKRVREWEGESTPVKKHATEETKARLDDHVSRRVSPPGQIPSPAELHRRSSSEIRRENERRANDNYHPSEAAHHPPSLPSMHVPQHLPPMNDAPKDERKEQIEPAARKMDVDEDYDKDSGDEKRGTAGARNSPPNGITNGQAKQDVPI